MSNTKIKLSIKNRWTGNVIFEYEKEDNTQRETILEAINLRADLSDANLSDANLSRADLSRANLRDANLSRANLSRANLSDIKNEFWCKLLKLKKEVPAFRGKLIEGKINGSCYEGECCCFVGTFSNLQGVKYTQLNGVPADASSRTERWFLGIKTGDTVESSSVVKITVEWIDEFILYMNN